MCSKCNGTLDDHKPRGAKELLAEAERRKKKREEQENTGSRFIEENFR